MRWIGLSSIRGQLVLWYLGILALVLAGLGIFQWVTLGDYLRTSTTDSIRRAAFQELSVLGPCYVRSSGQLSRNAQTLSGLLGGHDTGVTIVTPAGQTLAAHSLGPPGASRPLSLTASTIRGLIDRTASLSGTRPTAIRVTTCPRPFAGSFRSHHENNGVPHWANALVSGNKVLLVAVPLGPPGNVVGYAILGRSMESANATAARVLLVFGLGAAAALLLAALVALPIINRALWPLRRVTTTAEAIASGDVAQRANLARSRDEVGRLGEAFDTMVDRLQDAMSATIASEERMRRFLADASHELRTPVTVLRGASQVLLRQGSDERPEFIAALNDMHEEALRLSRLVDDLLTLSRLDAGQQLAPQRVELRPFLHEFRDRYGDVWADRTIEIEDGAIDRATAYVDPEALRRVLTNLVDNAARYSRARGAITISAEVANTTTAIVIADEGPGLGSEDADQVFHRFYRAQKSRSRSSGGSGLGLAIVRGLVEGSGGSISMDTGPDRGTTVTVRLPQVAAG